MNQFESLRQCPICRGKINPDRPRRRLHLELTQIDDSRLRACEQELAECRVKLAASAQQLVSLKQQLEQASQDKMSWRKKAEEAITSLNKSNTELVRLKRGAEKEFQQNKRKTKSDLEEAAKKERAGFAGERKSRLERAAADAERVGLARERDSIVKESAEFSAKSNAALVNQIRLNMPNMEVSRPKAQIVKLQSPEMIDISGDSD